MKMQNVEETGRFFLSWKKVQRNGKISLRAKNIMPETTVMTVVKYDSETWH
jgi:hypothetical protein